MPSSGGGRLGLEAGRRAARGPSDVWLVMSVITWRRRDEVADVPRLGLGERAGAAVGLGQRVGVGARAAPEAAVVAVRVDARLGQADRGLRAVAGLGVVGEAAVLAPVLAAGARRC